MTIKFYKYSGFEKKVNKSAELALLTPINITSDKISGGQDIERPVLTINGADNSLFDYNYIYIQDWKRYYFVRNKVWLGENIYQITCEEDVLNSFAVPMSVAGTYGIARYSGLGDKNLVDSRVVFQPAPDFDEYRIFYGNQTAVPLQYWYCVKFVSTDPFPSGSVYSVFAHNIVNVAIMNEEAYVQFVKNYDALAEADRVVVGAAVRSVTRVRYIAPDPNAMSSYLVTSLRFMSPVSTKVVEVSTSVQDSVCYILTDQDAVESMFVRPCTVVDANNSTVYFNTDGVFYKLHSLYILKLPELQPITFDPSVYGKTTNFTIDFNIGYEPFSEQYIIQLFATSIADRGPLPPVVQQATITVPFLSDTSLDLLEQKSLNNALSMIGGIAGGVGSVAAGAATGDIFSIGAGVGSMATSVNNYDMAQKQAANAEATGYGITSSLGGSPDWVMNGFVANSDARLFNIVQKPVRTFFNTYGIPDGGIRSVLGLAGTGYAELAVDDLEKLPDTTQSERDRLKALFASGVYF